MTVGELMFILSIYDKDSKVFIYDYESLEESEIDMIKSSGKDVILYYE